MLEKITKTSHFLPLMADVLVIQYPKTEKSAKSYFQLSQVKSMQSNQGQTTNLSELKNISNGSRKSHPINIKLKWYFESV